MSVQSKAWARPGSLVAAFLALGVVGNAEAVDWLPDFGLSKDEGKAVWDAGDQFVRLAKQDAGLGPRPALNNHPVTLEPPQLAVALGSLEMRLKRGEDTTIPVFVDSEVRVLSKYLAVGLAEAAPDEDVTFAVIGMHRGEGLGLFGRDLFGKSQKVTTGRVFYQEAKLNVIFGVIHGEVRQPKDEQAKQAVAGANADLDRRLHAFIPGSRASEQSHSWQLVLADGEALRSTGDVSRGDWLVLDLPVVVAAVERKAKEAAEPQGTAQEAAYLRQEAERLGAERRQMREEMARMRKQMQEIQASGASDASGESLEERLAILDDLKKKKLISEEEYEAKRQEILNDI
ncbi:MAG: SHOCT domain-containing protein [Gammaproteobacteria bacterium]|nr:SHOCT domain-containing protein [Gammaproteobacteria bacterium]